MTPRGIRNNNPGNIRASGIHWPGEGPPDSDGFCTFQQPEQGIAAIGANLRAYQNRHNLRTVNGIIRRWSATDQDIYVASVARALGVGPDDEINVLNPDTLFKLVVAIIRQENGQQPYTYAVLCEGLSIPPGAIVEHVETQPAAPIKDHSDVTFTVGGADNSNTVSQGGSVGIALPLLAQLIPNVINLFSGRAQAAIAQKTGADPNVAAQFMQGLIQKVGELVNVPVNDDASAIQAVAELRKIASDQAAKIKQLEDGALDYLHELTEAARALVDIRKQEVDIDTASADAAAKRQQPGGWDMARTLIYGALAGAGYMLVFVSAVAALQIWLRPDHTPTTEVWAAIVGLISFTTGVVLTIIAFRFGSSTGSGAKDLVIGEMIRRQPKGA